MLDLRLRFDFQRVRLRIAEGANPAIHVTDVLFGPFCFEPDSLNATLRAHAL